MSFSVGTAATRASTVTAPEVYPTEVLLSAEPAIVPPVARITMCGSFFPCASAGRTCAERRSVNRMTRMRFMAFFLCW